MITFRQINLAYKQLLAAEQRWKQLCRKAINQKIELDHYCEMQAEVTHQPVGWSIFSVLMIAAHFGLAIMTAATLQEFIQNLVEGISPWVSWPVSVSIVVGYTLTVGHLFERGIRRQPDSIRADGRSYNPSYLIFATAAIAAYFLLLMMMVEALLENEDNTNLAYTIELIYAYAVGELLFGFFALKGYELLYVLLNIRLKKTWLSMTERSKAEAFVRFKELTTYHDQLLHVVAKESPEDYAAFNGQLIDRPDMQDTEQPADRSHQA